MSYVIKDGELYHYGVPGMKWGQRKLDRQQKTVKDLSAKRKQYREEDGVSSRKYRNASKKLYLAKAKRDLTKGKLDNDSVAKILAKEGISNYKIRNKYGWDGTTMSSKEFNKVFGYDLTSKERTAVQIAEFNRSLAKNRVRKAKRVLGTTAAAVSPFVLKKGVDYYNKNRYKISSKLSNKNVDLINKGINFINKLAK